MKRGAEEIGCASNTVEEAPLKSPIGGVPEDWTVARLGDLTTKIGSGATPRGGDAAYLPDRDKYALVRSQNVYDRRFDGHSAAFISNDDADHLRNVELQVGDVLLNITGDGITFSRACIVDPSVLPARVNQHVAIIRCDRKVLDPGFLLSYLTHPDVKPYMESFNSGGSRRALTKGHIERFVLPLPPLSEQRRISQVLTTFDDKIDLNRKMNATLEQIAHALFKSWFVYFDPVKSKAEGREPEGMDPKTAALFPGEFEGSSLGRIPRGWRAVALNDLFEVRGGGTPKTRKSAFWDGDIPWFSVADAPRDSDVFCIRTDKLISRLGLENCSASLLRKGTTIISARGTVGKLAVVGRPMAMNQSCYGLEGRLGDFSLTTRSRELSHRLSKRLTAPCSIPSHGQPSAPWRRSPQSPKSASSSRRACPR